jgi:hypothetical protein
VGAKARTPLKQLPWVIREVSQALAPLKPISARLKYTGSLDVDNEGGASLGAKADMADVSAVLTGGVPLSVDAGWRSGHDNQGSADWELEVTFA